MKRLKAFLATLFPERAYPGGELWGYWIAHAEMLRWVAALLVVAMVVMSVTVVIVVRKPPVVIRVDEVGNAVPINDLATNNAPSDVEMTAFGKDFLRAYLELNSLTIQKDLARALNMMTKRFQSAHLRELKAENFLQKIIKANIQTQLELKHIAITSKTPARAYLDIRAITSTTPLEDAHATPTRHGLIAKLTLVLVPRTERTPNGLLVEDYRQQIVPLEEMLGPEKVLPKDEGREVTP
ncbi:MAG TPA: VirB8/TrbF family protein [bacterium]|nr:VirB8/TrbF family protein [bacterium]